MRSTAWSFLLLSTLLGPTNVLCQTFNLQDNYVGDKFFSGFTWFNGSDPTHGRVQYVDMDIAKSSNLSYATDSTFVMRADSTSTVAASDPGRKSVRISSIQTYTDSLLVLDVAHMPEGCATWPAFWTVTADQTWPAGGEIDIVEGVNTGTNNQATLHTTSGCSMPGSRQMSGTSTGSDCTSSGSNNNGCGVTFTKPNSYGSALNGVGGGWYVMKRTAADGVDIWFWARNDGSVPADVKSGAQSLTPGDSWGTPDASFPTTSCDWASHFSDHRIIFDLTFCGDWAGAAFSGSCSGDCATYVNESPDKFQDAYWTVNAVRAYVPGANSTSTSGSSGGTGGNSTLSTNQSGSGPESSTLSGDGASGTVGATASKTGGSKPTKC